MLQEDEFTGTKCPQAAADGDSLAEVVFSAPL